MLAKPKPFPLTSGKSISVCLSTTLWVPVHERWRKASAYSRIRHFLVFFPHCASTAVWCPRLLQGIWNGPICRREPPWQNHSSEWRQTNPFLDLFFVVNLIYACHAQFWTVLNVMVLLLLMVCKHLPVIKIAMSSAFATILGALQSKFFNSLLISKVYKSRDKTTPG